MRRIGFLLLILAMVCATAAGHAQNIPSMPAAPSPAPSASVIVVLDFNEAVLGTSEAQKSMHALQAKYAPREQQLQKLNDEIEAAKRALSDPASKLSDAEKNQRLINLGTKEKQLQRDAEDFKNDSQAESQRVFQAVATKFFSFLQDFSQQHGYTAVIERGTENAPVVWYTASNVDVTGALIKGYDAKFGEGAATIQDKRAPNHSSPQASPNP